jgi:hypothetical protein|nr:MAG TPA: hypothetical protein [Caudoviricetes sp.]
MDTKYIPGDLVIYTSLIKDYIAEICEVYETSYLIGFMRRNSARVTSKEIKPIPLTPAILERNGWDKEGKDGSVFSLSEAFMGGDKDDEDNYTCFQLYYQNKEDGWDIDMRGEPLKYEIHYVHELQHLFFGLGLDSSMIV